MKSIELKMIEDSGIDIACNGRVTHRIRRKDEVFTIADVSVKKSDGVPRQFASRSGAVNYLMHSLVEKD